MTVRKGTGFLAVSSSRTHLQQGMAVLTIVAILLSAITFATLSTSQKVQQYYAIEKVRQHTENSQVMLKQHIRGIASALRTQSVSSVLNTINNTNFLTTIQVDELEGAQHQPLTHYEISVSHDTENIKYKAKFLRYPALLRIPTPAQQFSWDSELTQWLFNRDVTALSADFFPSSITATQCHNIVPASIYWIDGNCVLDSSALSHSSNSQPTLLFVVNGDVSLSANTHFYGLIVMLSTTSSSYTLNVSASATVTGAYVSNAPIYSNINGIIAPSPALLKTLQAHTALAKIIPIPGAWYDID